MGSEEVPDVLNAPEPFFPLVRAGDTLMVAKHQVREVELADDTGLEAAVAPVAARGSRRSHPARWDGPRRPAAISRCRPIGLDCSTISTATRSDS